MGTIESNVEKNMARLEAQLKLWGAKLDEVKAKASAAGQQAKAETSKQLDELKAKLEAARAKLDEAKAAGSSKWETFMSGVEQTWKDLEKTFTRLVH